MPVLCRKITGKRCRKHKGQVVDGRTYAELPYAVIARKIIHDKARRQRDHHSGSYAEDTAYDYECRHAFGKEAGYAAQQEYRQAVGKYPCLVTADRESARKQHERYYQQRRQRCKHLYLQIAGFGKNGIQVAENGGDGKSRQRHYGRHRPYCKQHGKRYGPLSCLDCHMRSLCFAIHFASVVPKTAGAPDQIRRPCKLSVRDYCSFTQRTCMAFALYWSEVALKALITARLVLRSKNIALAFVAVAEPAALVQ